MQKDKKDKFSAFLDWMSSVDPRQEAAIMRRLSGSSYTVQMEMASFAYQDGQEHFYMVLE